MPLVPGSRIGVYEVTNQLGTGGMGEVYRARDTTLGRQVAIKILPDAFASDPDRLARFEREARTLASLNHPHIATIYAVETSAGLHALVMELVEGEDLSQRIARGAIPIDEALPIARQIAEALGAAHDQGIVHRDLKPANIKVTPDGAVKVLDFGLAKAMETSPSATDLSKSPTITSPAMTDAGMILGTAAYMSPEQAKGRPVDKRADIWAFGCVLYEMLTGQRAFPGENVADTLASVIRGEPDGTALPLQTPPAITRLITRCLVKDRKARLPDIAIVAYEIDDVLARPAAQAVAVAPTASARRTRPFAAIAAGVFGALVAGAAVWMVQHPAELVVTNVEIQHTDGRTPISGSATQGTSVAISADGRAIAYAVEGPSSLRLFGRSLDQRASVEYNAAIAGTSSPFFSPDGLWVGFLDSDGTIKKVPASGGAAVVVGKNTQGATRGAAWGGDGFIVFADGDLKTGLRRIPEGGGAIETLTVPQSGEYDHLWPNILPNGKGILFTITTSGLAASDTTRIAVLDVKTRQVRVLLEGGSCPRYAPSGHLVYVYRDSLMAVPFDEESLKIVGTPATVVDHVFAKQSGAADFDISRNGTLIYVLGESAPQRSLVWVEPDGQETAIPTELRAFAYPRVSPDETRVALDIRDQEADTWILDLTRCTPNCPLTRLTFDKGINRGVAWNPDGTRLAFSSQRDGIESVYWQNADGSGTADALTSGGLLPQIPSSFTPDGKWLLFNQPGVAPYDVFRVSLDREHRIEPVLTESYSEFMAEVSPDGHWVAFQSNEAGSVEVYVRSYPNVTAQRVKVSSGGRATRPAWSRDGKKLFYFVEPGSIYEVPLTFTPTLSAGAPKLLFTGRYLVPQDGRSYDVSPKADRFLMIKDATPVTASLPRLEVVFNWTEELKRVAPRR